MCYEKDILMEMDKEIDYLYSDIISRLDTAINDYYDYYYEVAAPAA